MSDEQIDWDALKLAAEAALPRAYAPYSSFRVGAAVLGADGRIFSAVNVENASYGLTVCAERNAIASAIAAGCRRFRALSIVCSGRDPAAPCGACRQVIAEFPPIAAVRSYGCAGAQLEIGPEQLLPSAFRLERG